MWRQRRPAGSSPAHQRFNVLFPSSTVILSHIFKLHNVCVLFFMTTGDMIVCIYSIIERNHLPDQ